MSDRVEVYRDEANEHRWRLIAGNGEIIADSSEGYVNLSDCEEMAAHVNPGVPVLVLEED